MLGCPARSGTRSDLKRFWNLVTLMGNRWIGSQLAMYDANGPGQGLRPCRTAVM